MVVPRSLYLRCSSIFFGLAIFYCAESSLGQVQINVEETNVTGTVVRVSPLALTIKTALGIYEVDVVNREFNNLGPAEIEVKGEKPRKFLQRGMTVRFTGQVELGRKIRDPLTEITVVDPAAAAGVAHGRGEGERPDAAAGDAEVIVGRIRTSRLNVLSVEVPDERRPRVLQAKLADDAVVKISFGNLSAARPGDKVHIRGWKQIGGRGRRIWAEQVTVTSSADPPDARLARDGKARPAGPRRAFGEIADEAEEPAAEEGGPEYEGVILEVN